MKERAPGVWQVYGYRGFLPNMINTYVIGDVLIDAATRNSAKRILRELDGHEINAHALTHAHPDHQGASAEICETLGIPFWCPEGDADAAENPELIRERQPSTIPARFYISIFMGPGRKVDRKLKEGDEVAGFRTIHTPGHSRGQMVFWRESDRVLVIGDVLTNMETITGIPGLHEPKPYLTPDPAENRRSAKKLVDLDPELVLFGHGPPLRDPGKFREFVEGLPD
jgi:glyoxylase-like metal-dependent hydrolase (beta-lactamase superfamily II)